MMKKITFLLTLITALNVNYSNAQCSYHVELDGVDEYLYTPFNDYTFNNFTMECWIKVPDYSANIHYISLYQNVYVVLGDWSGGSFTTWADGLSPIDIGPSSLIGTANDWHHVAFVYDGSNQYLYIDGILDVATATTGAVTHNNTSFNQGLVIGARYTQATQFVNGAIDEVRIWNVARSQGEIQTDMNNLLTGSEAGLVAYYSFDDGPASTTAADLTGNGNDLALMNMEEMTDWGSNSLTNFLTTTVTQNGSQLTADYAGGSYQWLDCDNGNAPIAGAVNQFFTPTATGNYAVEITDGSCVDTSNCIMVDLTAVSELTNQELTLYPNPSANGSFTVQLDGEVLGMNIFDLQGRLVFNTTSGDKSVVTGLENGHYLVQIETNTGVAIRELIVRD